MKRRFFLAGWILVSTAALVGLLLTTAFCDDAPKASGPAPYLAGATYLGVKKCLMCHKGMNADIVKAWQLTKHAKLNSGDEPLPWKEGEKPAPEVAYRYMTGTDNGVTCEACHGPGSKHMPASHELKKTTIAMPSSFATAGQKVSLCGRCHGQYTIDGKTYAAKYYPGQDLLTTEGFKLDPIKDGQSMQQLNEFVTSKHFTDKGMACETCHAPHSATAVQPYSLKKPVTDLCLSCHKDKVIAQHAPKAPADATCATCHMAKGVHTFTKPAQ